MIKCHASIAHDNECNKAHAVNIILCISNIAHIAHDDEGVILDMTKPTTGQFFFPCKNLAFRKHVTWALSDTYEQLFKLHERELFSSSVHLKTKRKWPENIGLFTQRSPRQMTEGSVECGSCGDKWRLVWELGISSHRCKSENERFCLQSVKGEITLDWTITDLLSSSRTMTHGNRVWKECSTEEVARWLISRWSPCGRN